MLKTVKLIDLKEKFPNYWAISNEFIIPENENSIFINLVRQTLYPDTFLAEKIAEKQKNVIQHFKSEIFYPENLQNLLKQGMDGTEEEIEEISDLYEIFKTLKKEPWFWQKVKEAFFAGHILVLAPTTTNIDFTGILQIPANEDNEFLLNFFISFPFYRWKEDGFWIDGKKLLVYTDKVVYNQQQYVAHSLIR